MPRRSSVAVLAALVVANVLAWWWYTRGDGPARAERGARGSGSAVAGGDAGNGCQRRDRCSGRPGGQRCQAACRTARRRRRQRNHFVGAAGACAARGRPTLPPQRRAGRRPRRAGARPRRAAAAQRRARPRARRAWPMPPPAAPSSLRRRARRPARTLRRTQLLLDAGVHQARVPEPRRQRARRMREAARAGSGAVAEQRTLATPTPKRALAAGGRGRGEAQTGARGRRRGRPLSRPCRLQSPCATRGGCSWHVGSATSSQNRDPGCSQERQFFRGRSTARAPRCGAGSGRSGR